MSDDADTPKGGADGERDATHDTGDATRGDGRTPSDRAVDTGHLTLELQDDLDRITELAKRSGLRFWETRFEVISRRRMVELGTYVLPYRWAHWTFGREYARMQKLHDLGLVDILELVVNTRPARAYLLDANSRDDNRMVMAHVLAHVDFFANNMWFERTPDNILREAHHHERRIRDLQDLYGHDRVEAALDHALSIQWHVDFYRHYEQATPRTDTGGPDQTTEATTIENRRGPAPRAAPELVPEGGHRDLLEFLAAHGPVDELEREVLEIVREETLYFYPNALTKIMNEGWATYWHAEIMREFLAFDAFDRFAVKHSHLMQSEGLNPYKLGFLIYEDIRARGDRDYGPGQGLKRIYEVRRYGDDVSFLRDHLTQDVVDKAGLYLYDEDPETGERVVTSTRVEDIKPMVLGQLENLGKPFIVVKSGDHNDEGHLLIEHRFDGREIDLDYAGDVLKEIRAFWKRPVHLDTRVQGKRMRLSLVEDQPRLVDLEREEARRGSDQPADGDGRTRSDQRGDRGSQGQGDGTRGDNRGSRNDDNDGNADGDDDTGPLRLGAGANRP